MYVVVPWSHYLPQQYRFADYAAYFRKVKRELFNAVTQLLLHRYRYFGGLLGNTFGCAAFMRFRSPGRSRRPPWGDLHKSSRMTAMRSRRFSGTRNSFAVFIDCRSFVLGLRLELRLVEGGPAGRPKHGAGASVGLHKAIFAGRA
jgi:hypothetical protein